MPPARIKLARSSPEHPRDLRPGHSYVIHGERFNGMTQAVAYGDDATMATNYPIVRLISEDGRVHYCRTFDHSTMAVATVENLAVKGLARTRLAKSVHGAGWSRFVGMLE